MRLDTWYYDAAFDEKLSGVCRADLGDGPIRVEAGAAEFVSEHIAAIQQAFSSFIVPTSLAIGYMPSWNIPAIPRIHLPAHEARFEDEDIRAAVRGLSGAVVFITMLFDARLSVRECDGRVTEVLLPQAGRFHLLSDYDQGEPAWKRYVSPAARRGVTPWSMTLECYVLPLFRSDNSSVLQHVRTLWTALRARIPAMTEIAGGEEADHVVTLVNPPFGTPPSNIELYDHNAPLLLSAVRTWEQTVDHIIQWTTSLSGSR